MDKFGQKLAEIAKPQIPKGAFHRSIEDQIIRRAAMDEERKRAKELIEAMEGGVPSEYMFGTGTIRPMTIQETIRQRIESHKRMIATLEWFGAHIGLDSPDNTLVADVIMSGLRAIADRGKPERGP